MPMTEHEATLKAKQALNISTLHVKSKQGKTLTINSTGTGTTDNELIKTICLEFKGASFKQLPVDIQNKFNSSTRAKYPAVSGYYKQLLNNANGNDGIFADMIRLHGSDNITPEIVNETSKNANGDPSTKGRFINALEIYKSR